jgi:hypothetical protein
VLGSIAVTVEVSSDCFPVEFFFGLPFYLQTARVHSANGVTREACRGALSSTSPHLTDSKPYVSVTPVE